MTRRVLVVGGDAAGMSAATQALRTARASGRDLEVVAVERGHWASYSACGIPYWVAGDVDDAEALVARTPEEHRANGIDLRLRTEVVSLDLGRGEAEIIDADTGTRGRLGFDELVLTTGAEPVRPPLPGVDAAGIHGLQTLDDGAALLDRLQREQPRRAVVAGAGYIGVEVSEALVRRGLEVTVLTKSAEPMDSLDDDMGRAVHAAMEELGIDVVTGVEIEGFAAGSDGHVTSVEAGGVSYGCDVVVLGLGVRPATALAKAAGLPLGDSGGLRVDLRMAVPGHDGVWAAGDCVESFDRVAQTWVHVPLGTHANKQGRVLGTNLGGGYATFPGIVRTAVSKMCDLEMARTGLLERDAAAAGFRFVTEVVQSTNRAGYMPGARELTVKVVAEENTGRLLGAQVVGREDSAKRIDTLALALWNDMTVHELAMVDFGYAPPFSPVWDPVLIAARKASERVLAGSAGQR